MLPALGLGEDGMTPPRLFSALPPLKPLGLPTAVEARMEGRREWLQQLFDDELARASRTARGEMSAMEAACGVEPLWRPMQRSRVGWRPYCSSLRRSVREW